MKNLLFAFCCILSLQIRAEAHEDTLKKVTADTTKRTPIRAASFIIPAALVTYGALSFAVHPIRQVDYDIHNQIAQSAPNFHTNAESYFMFTPIVMVYGLNLAGVEGRNNFTDRTAILALSAAFGGITDVSVKHLSHRLDPGKVSYTSFPSSHTIAAFAGAEFLAQEYGYRSPVYTIAGYAIAVTTGAFRLYNRDHWFSDVVAGAGVGIASTKLAYLVYPSIKKWLTHTDKAGKSTFIMPTYQDGMAGLAFSKTF